MPDTMHMISLGLAKTMLKSLVSGWKDAHYDIANAKLNKLRLPSSLPRPMRALQTDLSTITAAQLAIFVAGASMYVLNGLISANEMAIWQHLVMIQRLCMQYTMTEDDLRILEHHINCMCDMWKLVWPTDGAVPNLHFLRHLPSSIRRYGSPYGINTYASERFNGWLKRVGNNGTAVENQLMKNQMHFVLFTLADTVYDNINMTVADVGLVAKVIRLNSDVVVLSDSMIQLGRDLPTRKGIVDGSEPIAYTLLNTERFHMSEDVRTMVTRYLSEITYEGKRVDITIGTWVDKAQRCRLGYRMITCEQWRSTRESFILAHFPRDNGGPLPANNTWLTPGRVKCFIRLPITIKENGNERQAEHAFAQVVWYVRGQTSTGKQKGYKALPALEDNGYSTAWLNQPLLFKDDQYGVMQSLLPLSRIAGTFMPVFTKEGVDRAVWVIWLPPHF